MVVFLRYGHLYIRPSLHKCQPFKLFWAYLHFSANDKRSLASFTNAYSIGSLQIAQCFAQFIINSCANWNFLICAALPRSCSRV